MAYLNGLKGVAIAAGVLAALVYLVHLGVAMQQQATDYTDSVGVAAARTLLELSGSLSTLAGVALVGWLVAAAIAQPATHTAD